MRNVDRDVLREAVDLAGIWDLFTPTFQVDLFAKLEELGERNKVLEALAFGTVIVRMFRLAIFFIRLLPSTRTMLIATALLVAVDRALAHEKIPTVQDLRQFANEAGITDVTKGIFDDIREALAPFVVSLRQAEQIVGQSLIEITVETEKIRNALIQMEVRIKNGFWNSGVEMSEKIRTTGLDGIEILSDNLVNLVVRPMGRSIDRLEDFNPADIFGKATDTAA